MKLLDFGLALLTQDLRARFADIAGTLGYIAPEVLVGAPPSEASELFAVGVMAHELFLGAHPFGIPPAGALTQDFAAASPILSDERRIPAALSAVLGRALRQAPKDRYGDAAEFAHELARALDLPIPVETTEIRESFLQAATFIARDDELATLQQALDAAAAGRGAVWLIGGESGVGKSRLLEELRTRALVRGASVLRGQAVSAGGGAYQVWQEILRTLGLDAALDDLDAGVLRAVVPELAALLDRPVPEPPPIDPQNAQSRFLSAVERLLLSQQGLLVLLLEDLHWAEPASLALLQRLMNTVAHRPLLIVGNYRQDERPTLPHELPGAHSLLLRRFSRDELALLSTSMLGETSQHLNLINLLERETEGNAFFVVEVIRALAEEAGRLSEVGKRGVPEQIVAGGVQAVLQRRLGRVPEPARALLRLAAMAGRTLELPLLRSSFPELDAWLGPCADVAVLEVQDQCWRFAHDKLREAILSSIGIEEQRRLHGQIAQTLEASHPEVGPHAPRLAFHYQGAGNVEKAAHYSALAGELAVQQGALSEALVLLQKALPMQKAAAAPLREQLRTRRFLTDALFGLGRSQEAVAALEAAMALLGISVPSVPLTLATGMLRQMGEQLLRRLGSAQRLPAPSSEQRILIEEFIPALRNCEAYLYLNHIPQAIYVALLGLNLAESVSNLPQQVTGAISVSFMASTIPLRPLRELYERLAILAAASCSDVRPKLDLLRTQAHLELADGHLDASLRLADAAVAGARRIGDENLQVVGMLYQHGSAIYLGDYARAERIFDESQRIASRGRNLEYQRASLALQSFLHFRRGAFALAEQELRNNLRLGPPDKFLTPRVWSLQAVCALRRGDAQQAQRLADAAWAELRSAPATIPAFIEADAQVLEVYLHLAQTNPAAQLRRRIAQLLKHMQRLVQALKIGQPTVALYLGRGAWLSGHAADALGWFQRSLQAAVRLAMPYEEAQAHAWLGRLMQSADRPASAIGESAMHFGAARKLFEKLGAVWDREELERRLA